MPLKFVEPKTDAEKAELKRFEADSGPIDGPTVVKVDQNAPIIDDQPVHRDDVKPERVEPAPKIPRETKPRQPSIPDLIKGKEEADRRAQDAAARAQRAEAEAAEARALAEQARTQTHQSQLDGLLNAIGAAQSEADAAEQELMNAHAANDAAAIAKAQRKLSVATSRQTTLEQQKQIFDQQAQQRKTQPQPKPQQRAYGIEDALANMTGLMGAEQDWLRKHPDLVLDQAKNRKLTVYFDEAVDQGLERGSQEFLDFMEGRLGFQKPSKNGQNGQHRQREPKHVDEEPRYAAPPSRSGLDLNGGVDNDSQVTLTPEMREAARMAGISEAEYAKQVLVLRQRKREGNYQ